jgi:hypothetical protein
MTIVTPRTSPARAGKEKPSLRHPPNHSLPRAARGGRGGGGGHGVWWWSHTPAADTPFALHAPAAAGRNAAAVSETGETTFDNVHYSF